MAASVQGRSILKWGTPHDAALVAAAAAVHVALGLALLPAPLFMKYPILAELLARGQLTPEAAADASPAYLLLNVLAQPGVIRVLQSLAGGAMVALAFLAARPHFGRLASHLAAWGLALAAPLLIYEAVLEPEVALATFALLALAILSTGKDASLARLGVAGAALGVAIALRPSAALYALATATWLIARPGPRARRALQVAAHLAAAASVTVAARVALSARIPTALGTTMSIGEVLHHGNRPESDGLGPNPPFLLKSYEGQLPASEGLDRVHAAYRAFARASAGAQLSAAECEQFWIDEVARFVRAEPGALAALMAKKLLFAVAGPELDDIPDVRTARLRVARRPLLGAQLLQALGLAGLLALALRRRSGALPALFLLAALGACGLFYVTSRYGVALVPLWCVLAGGLFELLAEARARPRELVLAAATLAAPIGLRELSAVRSQRLVLERLSRAVRPMGALAQARRLGDERGMTDAFVEAEAAFPPLRAIQDLRGLRFDAPALAGRAAVIAASKYDTSDDGAAFFLAQLAAWSGHCDQALPALDTLGASGFALAIHDRRFDPALLSARCLLELGRRDEALALALRSLHQAPGTLEGLAWASAGAGALGHADEQKRDEGELFALHDRLSADEALSRARLAWGDAAGALALAEDGLARLHDVALLEYDRARALVALGRLDEGVQAYGAAVRALPPFPFEPTPFDAPIAQLLAQRPDDPELLSIAARHFAREGQAGRAAQLATQALAHEGRPDRDELARIAREGTR